MQRRLVMKQKTDEIKMLFNYISRAYDSLEIWTQVYEITNPITEFRAKNEKRLGKVYEWLVFLIWYFWRYALTINLLLPLTMIYC